MKKIAFIVLLVLAASTITAAIPVNGSHSEGTGQADSAIVLLGNEPKMCYDQVFKVWYECYGRGLKNKYPWLSEKELQKKAEKLLDESESIWGSSCRRVWEDFPGGYYVYTCKWKGDLPANYLIKYYY